YRWMEIPNTDSIKQWLKYQRGITRSERASFSGICFNIYNAMLSVRSHYTLPTVVKKGKYYFKSFYTHNPYDVAPVLYIFQKGYQHQVSEYNPNKLSGKGIKRIVGFDLDSSSKYLAVSISRSGSDWQEIHIRDIDKGVDLPEVIEWTKSSNIVWHKDGFYYTRYDSVQTELKYIQNNSKQTLCYHKLGTSQQQDIGIIKSPNEESFLYCEMLDNTSLLIIYNKVLIRGTLYSTVSYMDIAKGIRSPIHEFIISPASKENTFNAVALVDKKILMQTTFDAPTGRILAFEKDSLNRSQEIIPAFSEILQSTSIINKSIVALYFNKGTYKAAVFDTTGEAMNIMYFDTGVHISNIYGRDNDSMGGYFQSSYYYPSIYTTVDFVNAKRDNPVKTEVHYDPNLYTTKILNYSSKDGTIIPMYITYKKGIDLKGNNPTILTGYGGFGINNAPGYSYSNILFFDNGGILAAPLIRGGGELGEEWHKAGKRLKKQNSIDDFIAAADYLVNEGYTTRGRLAIQGGSNGGLLVAAAMMQRPDLCKVVIAQMGVYDMLRFQNFTVGKYHISEYGTSTDSIDYQVLRSYSPLHNIRDSIDYPALLLLTGENDDRVPPLHTYKFLSTIQEKSSGTNPHIMYFEEDAGHNGAIGYYEAQYTDAFTMAFIFDQFKLKFRTPNR
ncbi:MAG: S9 family peptidase, partial [Bacteroidetes bacterium]|nr:S9 family peptidase [Bacteroidota bacterium]